MNILIKDTRIHIKLDAVVKDIVKDITIIDIVKAVFVDKIIIIIKVILV